ncbi:unnamed protein product [Euphydryas editha]|uniref:Reverse transcriptase domain-containing protein n=1 Tax=Euphydryas editha TaxID=104508 RepID=A0AAU9U436_EUPED|nr:unnamed protein product [Euphydryas editha]
MAQDPDVIYNSVFKLNLEEFYNIFKLKTLDVNVNLKFSEWASEGIYKSRNRLYELYSMKQWNQETRFLDYVKQYSKTFKAVCMAAKSKYIKDKIINSDNKIKCTWNIINSICGKRNKETILIELNINGAVVSSDDELANVIETFFDKIPIELTSQLNSSSTNSTQLLKNNVSKFKLISTIIDVLAPYLALTFNNAIKVGSFPDLLKYSKVLPIFKKGHRSDPSNYRSISVLPSLSKIFEKNILNQLLFHFKVNGIFHSEQYGFTRGRSTTDAGVALLKHIYDAWEKSQNAIGVFCDLSKAFDCVDHGILLSKLEYYGVNDKALDLIASYLSNRIQHVSINGTKSSGSVLKMGVPQGLILGPFLFLIYINDLPFYVKDICDIVLFADDTSLIFKVDRKKVNFDDVNSSLSRIQDWFKTNNLVLNAKKTKCVVFSLPNVKHPNYNVEINNERLIVNDTTVFLGINLDSKLQWNSHLSSLNGRLSSAAFAVRKAFCSITASRYLKLS